MGLGVSPGLQVQFAKSAALSLLSLSSFALGTALLSAASLRKPCVSQPLKEKHGVAVTSGKS